MDSRVLRSLLFIFLSLQSNAFCGSRRFQTSLLRSAVRAGEWLRNQQDANGTYGEGHTSALVFHSLRLIGHSVEGGASHLNDEINRNGLGSIPGGRLSLYILGALATCRIPQQFYNHNLIRALQTEVKKFPKPGFDDFFKYSLAVMALCSSGYDTLPYGNKIIKRISLGSEYVDKLAYEVMALACIRSKRGRKTPKKIVKAIDLGIEELLKRIGNESSLDENEVSTAVATQALFAAKQHKRNSCSKTLRWLQTRQNPDGSFNSFMSTVYAIPALIGALPHEIRDVPCQNSDLQDKPQRIRVCLEVKLEENKYTSDKSPPPPRCVKVLNGTSAHEVLKVAANEHPCYNFTTQKSSLGHMLVSICGVEWRPSENLYWSLYIDGRFSTVGIDDLRPGNGTTVLFKYQTAKW